MGENKAYYINEKEKNALLRHVSDKIKELKKEMNYCNNNNDMVEGARLKMDIKTLNGFLNKITLVRIIQGEWNG